MFIRVIIFVFFIFHCTIYSDGQFIRLKNIDIPSKLVPFPPCKADNIECLRHGLRTFFFLMNAEYLGMNTIDPITLNSLSVTLPDEQLSIHMRRVNVSGAQWTKLADKKFLEGQDKSSVRFQSDLHAVGEISVSMPGRFDPILAFITMDITDVESNITYAWIGERGNDKEDYILIGPERTVVRNSRTPTFFLQPGDTEDSLIISKMLHARPAVLDLLSNEITSAVMDVVVDNVRNFARNVPVRHYYIYNKA